MKKKILRVLAKTLCLGLACILGTSQPISALASSGVTFDLKPVRDMLGNLNFGLGRSEGESVLGIQVEESEEQVTFKAQSENVNAADVEEYGFIWSTDIDNPNPTLDKNDGSEKIKDALSGDNFSFDQKYPIEDVYFVRGYVKQKGLLRGNVLYSPAVPVKRENSTWKSSYSAYDHLDNVVESSDDSLVNIASHNFDTMGWEKFYSEAEVRENIVVNAHGFVVSYGLDEPTVVQYDEIIKNEEDGYDFFRYNLDKEKLLNAKVRPFVVYNHQFVTYGDTVQISGEREIHMVSGKKPNAELKDGVQYYQENNANLATGKEVDNALLKKIVWPKVEAKGVFEEGKLSLKGMIVEDYGHSINEYGFIWSTKDVNPSITSHEGIQSYTKAKNASLFEHAIPVDGQLYVKAYVIYDNGFVAYSNQLKNETDKFTTAEGTIKSQIKTIQPDEKAEKPKAEESEKTPKPDEKKSEANTEESKVENSEKKQESEENKSETNTEKSKEETKSTEEEPSDTDQAKDKAETKEELQKTPEQDVQPTENKALKNEQKEPVKEETAVNQDVKKEPVYDMSRREALQKGSRVPFLNTRDEYKWFLNLATSAETPTHTKLLHLDADTYASLLEDGSMFLVFRADVLGDTKVKFNGFDLGSMKNKENGYAYYVYEVHDYMLRNGTNVLEFFSPVFTAVSVGDVQIITNNGPMTNDTYITPSIVNDIQYQAGSTGLEAIIQAQTKVQNGLTNNLKMTTLTMAETLNQGTFDVGGGESIDITQNGSSDHSLALNMPLNVENLADYASYQILTTAENNQIIAIEKTRYYRNSANKISDFTVEFEPSSDRYVDTTKKPVQVKGYILPMKEKGILPLSKSDGINITEGENGIVSDFTLSTVEKGFLSQPFYQDSMEAFNAYYHVGNIDTTTPVIALRGEREVSMLADSKYQEQGFEIVHKDFATTDHDAFNYTALGYTVTTACFKKNSDGSLTNIEDYQTKSLEKGIYEIHYNATDITGHVAKQQIRIVTVLKDDITLNTLDANTIEKENVILGGKIEKLGSFEIAERGFFLKEINDEDPKNQVVTILNYENKYKMDKEDTTTGIFTTTVNKKQLKVGQRYGYASYAKNVNGHVQVGPTKLFQFQREDGTIKVENITNYADGYGYSIKITRDGGEYPARIWYQTADGSAVAGSRESGGFYESVKDYVDLKPGESKVIKINSWTGSEARGRYGNLSSREFYFEVYRAEAFKDAYEEDAVISALGVNNANITLTKAVSINYEKVVFNGGKTYQTSDMRNRHNIDDNEGESGDSWDKNKQHHMELDEAKRYLVNGNTINVQYAFHYVDDSIWGATKGEFHAKLYRKDTGSEIGNWSHDADDGDASMSWANTGTNISFVSKHSASGLSNNKWWLSDTKLNWKITDTIPPSSNGFTMTDTKRGPGQKVYASVYFNEPVEVISGTPSIRVRMGDKGTLLNLEYSKGSGTDILSFVGTVHESSTSGIPSLAIKTIQGFDTIKDFAGNRYDNSTLFNLNSNTKLTIENSEDYDIENMIPKKQWKVNVSAENLPKDGTIQYVWDTHASIVADTVGWQNAPENGELFTPAGASGKYYLHVRAGDTAKSAGYYVIDNEAPSVKLTHEASSPQANDGFEDGNNGKYTNKIRFKAKVIDQNVAPEEGNILYQVSNQSSYPTGDENWKPFLDNTEMLVEQADIAKTGVYYLHFKLLDKAGNAGKQTSKPYYIDKDAPIINENQIHISNMTNSGFQIDIKDVKDAGEGQPSKDMLPSGIRTIYVVSKWGDGGFKEDTMVQYLHTGTDGKVTKDFQHFVTAENKKEVSLSSRLDEGLGMLAEKNLLNVSSNTCKLTFKVVDMAGNETQITKDVELTVGKPSVTLTKVNGEDDAYRREPVTIHAIAKTALGGFDLETLSLPDGTVIKDNDENDRNDTLGIIEGNYQADKNGTYVFIASDKHGNLTNAEETITNIDDTAPKILIKDKEAQGSIDVEINDNLAIVYQIDQEPFKEYKGVFSIDLKERKFVTITAFDAAGNQMVYTYKKPYQPVQPEGEDTLQPNVTRIGKETIHLTLGDKYVEYGVYVEDNQDANPKIEIDDGGLDVNKEGTYVITYEVKDKAGNISVVSRNVIVEKAGNLTLAFEEKITNDNSGYTVLAEQLQSVLKVNRIQRVTQDLVESKNGYMKAEVSQDGTKLNSLKLIPNQYFNGEETLQLQVVTDTNEIRTVNLNVTFANIENAPIAEDDHYTSGQDDKFTVKNKLEDTYIPAVLPVMDNDWDPDMAQNQEPYFSTDEIHITKILTNGKKGTAVISEDKKTLLYTPNMYQHGEDFIEYEITDRLGHTDTAKVVFYIKDTVAPKYESVVTYIQDTDKEFSLDEDHYTNQSLRIEMRLTDYYGDGKSTGSGVKKLELIKEVDGQVTYEDKGIIPGADTSYTFHVDENATYKYRLTDTDGNQVLKDIVIDKIDKVAPELNAVWDGSTSLTGVDMTLAFSEKGVSGYESFTLQRDNQKVEDLFALETVSKEKGTGTYHVMNNGIYNIVLKDRAGNSVHQKINIQAIDNAPPAVSWTTDPDGLTYGKPADIILHATDSISKIAKIRYPDGTVKEIDKEEQLSKQDFRYEVKENGNYKFTVWDSLGLSTLINASVTNIALTAVAPTELIVNKENVELYINGKNEEKVTAIAGPEEATNKKIDWTSSHPEYVTVKEDGTITALKETGDLNVIVKAALNGAPEVSKDIQVKVTNVVEKISFEKNEFVLNRNNKIDFNAYTNGYSLDMKDADSADAEQALSNKRLMYASSNENVFTVDKDGVVTGLYPGTGMLTVLSDNGVIGTCVITVVIPVDKINFKDATYNKEDDIWEMKVSAGTETTLSASVYPITATNSKITYSLDEASAKYVTLTNPNTGSIKANAEGVAYLHATSVFDPSKKADIKITVVPKDTGVRLNIKEDKLYIGEQMKLESVVEPADSVLLDRSIEYSSENPNIASVEADGTITANYEGTTTITAKTKTGNTATCKVTVMKVIASISLSTTELSMYTGQKRAVSAFTEPQDSKDQTLKWYVKDDDKTNPIVKVDSKTGVITALRSGTATIVAAAEKSNYTPADKIVPFAECKITITTPVNNLEMYYYDHEELDAQKNPAENPEAIRHPFKENGEYKVITIPEGRSMQLSAESNKDADNKTITWKSSHPNILKIDEKTGRVQALHGDNNVLVTITAESANRVSKSVNMKVGEQVGDFKVSTVDKWITMKTQKGYESLSEFTLKSFFSDDYEGNRTVTFETLDDTIADIEVTQSGEAVITGLKEGVTYIKVTPEADESLAVLCRIRVDHIMTKEDIPDSAFFTVLKKQIDKDGATEGTGDGYLRRSEMQEYAGAVMASDKGIQDVKGAEELLHTEKLDISKNKKIKDTTPLEKMGMLKHLNVSTTGIKAFDFLKNAEGKARYARLESLMIADNDLSDPALLDLVVLNKNLLTLDISMNRFRELHVLGALPLRNLSVQYNELESPLRTQTVFDTMTNQYAEFKGIVSYQGPKDGDKLTHDALVWCGVGGTVVKKVDDKYYSLKRNVKYNYFDNGVHTFETYLATDTETTMLDVHVDCSSRELKLFKEIKNASNPGKAEYKFEPAAGAVIQVEDREYITNASGVVRIGYAHNFHDEIQINYSDNLAVDMIPDTAKKGSGLGTPGHNYIIKRQLDELPSNHNIYLYKSEMKVKKADITDQEKPQLTMLQMNKEGTSSTTYDVMSETVSIEKALKENYWLMPNVDWVETSGKIEFGIFNIQDSQDKTKFHEASDPYAQKKKFVNLLTLHDGEQTDVKSISKLLREKIVQDNTTSMYIHIIEGNKESFYKLPIQLFQYTRTDGDVAGSEASSGQDTGGSFGFDNGFEAGFGYGPVSASFVYDGEEFCVSAGFELDLKPDDDKKGDETKKETNDGSSGTESNTSSTQKTASSSAADESADASDWEEVKKAVSKGNDTQERFNRMKQMMEKGVGGFLKEGFMPAPNQSASDFMDSSVSMNFNLSIYGLMLENKDGSTSSYCTAGTISVGVGIGWEFSYPVIIGIIPAYTKIEVEANVGVSLNVKGPVEVGSDVVDADKKAEDYNTGWDDTTGEITVGAGVGLTLAVGVDGLASAGIKGNIEASVTTELGKEGADGSFTFEAGASLFIAILFFEYSHSFATYEYETSFGSKEGRNGMQVKTQMEGSGITSRSYAFDPSVYYQDVDKAAGTAKTMSTKGDQAEQHSNVDMSLIEANVYPYAEPVYKDLGDGRQILVWVDDCRDRQSVNKTALYYAICENGTWSKKQLVDDDGTADFSPDVVIAGNRVYVTWQNSKTSYTDVDIKQYSEDVQKQLLSDISIKTAMYDLKKNDGFKVIDGMFDSQENYHANVTIAASDSGKSAVVWSVNDRNSLMGNEGRSIIYYSTYEDGIYSEPIEITSTLSTIAYIDAQYHDDKLYIVYNEDRDNNLQTGNDKELYLFEPGKGIKQLTNDLAADVNPNLIVEDGKLKLYWIKDSKICVMNDLQNPASYTSIMNGEETISADQLEFASGYGHKAIFWEAMSQDTTTDVYGIFYDDKTNTWSDATKITDENKRLSKPSGFFDASGMLQSVTIVRDVESLDYIENEQKGKLATETLGTANLSELHIKPGYDIAIQNVRYDRNAVSAGETVEFYANIKNYGQKPVREVDIEIFNKGKLVEKSSATPLKEISVPQMVDGNEFVETSFEETVLQPGQTLPVKFTYKMPQNYSEYALNLAVSAGDGDLEERDNTYEIIFEETNLRLYLEKTHEKGTKRAFEYRVANSGGKAVNDINIALRYADTKQVIKNVTLEELKPGKSFRSEIEVDIDELDFAQSSELKGFELLVSADTKEITQTDNLVSTVLQPPKDDFIVRDLFEFEEKNASVKLGEEKATRMLVNGSLESTQAPEKDDSSIQLPIEETSIIYTSSNPKAVQIDADGVIKAVGEGTAEITAYDVLLDMTAVCRISVEIPAEGIKASQEDVNVAVGLSAEIGAEVLPNNTTDKNVTWTSDDESIAVIAAQKVYGVAPGVTTLKATTSDGAFTDEVTVYVRGRATGINLTETAITLQEGTLGKINANVLPMDAANQKIYYLSNKEDIVTVDADGTLTARGAGSAIITAATAEGNFQKECIITVLKKDQPTDNEEDNGNEEGDNGNGDNGNGGNGNGGNGNSTDNGVQVTPGIEKDTTPKPSITQTEQQVPKKDQQEETDKKVIQDQIIDITKNTTVTNDQITQALKDKQSKFVFYDADGKISYSWQFDPTKLNNELPESLDLGINFNSKYRDRLISLCNGYEGFFLSTNYRGELPAEAEITLRLDPQWRKEHNGNQLYIYHYDEVTDKLILLESGLIEKDGYVSFHTTKGGDFMITDQLIDTHEVNDKIESDTASQTIWYIMIAIAIAGTGTIGVLLYCKKKKKKEDDIE